MTVKTVAVLNYTDISFLAVSFPAVMTTVYKMYNVTLSVKVKCITFLFLCVEGVIQRFIFIFLIFIFNHFYWGIVYLQSCVSFKCIRKWFSHIYMCVCIYILFQILFYYRLLQDTEYSSLCYTVGPWHYYI